MFEGDHLIYIPQQTERLFVLTDNGSFDLKPRVGSRPVIRIPPESLEDSDGDVVVVYQSANSYVHYGSRERFFSFAWKKGAGDLRQLHENRRLPDSGFVERYKRFAKAIINIGPESELVNDTGVGRRLNSWLTARRCFQGQAMSSNFNSSIRENCFRKHKSPCPDGDGSVTSSRSLTDAQGG